MSSLTNALDTQRLQAQDQRRQVLTTSLFSAPAISPFFGVGIERSEQQQALQERNAPARAPEQEISTVAIDGSITRLSNVMTKLTASERSLSFDNDRAGDILDFLKTLRSDIETRLKEADESFDPPEIPQPVSRKISLERSEYVSTDAKVAGNQSRQGETRLGDLNDGKGISLTVTAGSNTHTVSATADETVADFVGRLNGQTGISAHLDHLGRVTVEANFGAPLDIREGEAGTFTALGIPPTGEDTSGNESVSLASALPSRVKETTVEKITVQRMPEDYQRRVENRNKSIEDHHEKLQKDLQSFWKNARENLDAEVERSLDRGSALLTGLATRLPATDGAAGGRSIMPGNLTVGGLGLTDVESWLREGRTDDVYDAIDAAIGKVNRAQSAFSYAMSSVETEQNSAERKIGRLSDQRDAITDAFTAQFVAKQTGLDLKAVQLATALNRKDDLRKL
jgi:hypothetical protein